MQKLIKNALRRFLPSAKLTPAAEQERGRDRLGLIHEVAPEPQICIDAALSWLCRAQDLSASADGGVARDFSLVKGWATSYPETTGYIIPTFIDLANRYGREDLHQRARRMLDWCVAIQFEDGGFQGGKVDATPRVPVTFNTGQILLGLSAGARQYQDESYLRAMHRAAAWLRDSLDADGCWRKHPTPFAAQGEKAYETHVAWGLFEAERVAPGHGYGEAGLRQVDWALTKQARNGWFSSNCLTNPQSPLTHTIGYVLRGVIEGYRLSERPELLAAAKATADGLRNAIESDGRLPGRLSAQWTGEAAYVCLTGSVQIAHCLFLLHQITGESGYWEKGQQLTSYVRRTVRLDGPENQCGAIKGSFPIDGDYGQWEYLNWAAKFFIDAHLLELDIKGKNHA
jgi:hypothetical protein